MMRITWNLFKTTFPAEQMIYIQDEENNYAVWVTTGNQQISIYLDTFSDILDFEMNYKSNANESTDAMGLIVLKSLWKRENNNIYRETGNVGIGTINPLQKLHIKDGAIRLESISSLTDLAEGDIYFNGTQLLMYINSNLRDISHLHNNKIELDKVTDGSHDIRIDNPHQVIKGQIGLGNVDNVQQIPMSQKGQINGVVPLDQNGKISETFLPDSIIGQMEYIGTWNANLNIPVIPTASINNKGWYYKVNVSGHTNINGIFDWVIGDWIVSNGTTWDKIDNSENIFEDIKYLEFSYADNNAIQLSSTYRSLNTFLFKGSKFFGKITAIKAITSVSNGNIQIRIMDVTNNIILARSDIFNNSSKRIIDIILLADTPIDETIIEIQGCDVSGNRKPILNLYALSISF